MGTNPSCWVRFCSSLMAITVRFESGSCLVCKERVRSGSVRFFQQDAQLSQRDCAAGCVVVFAKSRRLELGDNILQTL